MTGAIMSKLARPSTLLGLLQGIEADPAHHLTGPFRPQTPLSWKSKSRLPAPKRANGRVSKKNKWHTGSEGLWADIGSLRWAVAPSSALKILLVPIVLWAVWERFGPSIAKGLLNPIAPLFFISHRVPDSSEDDPRYAKGYSDLLFIAYHVIVWSFVRQAITIYISRPLAGWFGIKRESKLARFGEQIYAVIYFGTMAAWGTRIMSQLPTWWYKTEHFWIDYPHWQMTPELKRYYLMQAAYWCQQLLVLALKLEKPRKDYNELVAHHMITLWLVGWSYLVNLTLIGSAVYLSMDLPDTFLGISKLLDYIKWDRANVVVFMCFLMLWTYFRHWLNLVMLYSVWTEFDLIPETSKQWTPPDGVWMVWWMRYQIFVPLLLLQILNLFWYMFILRILKGQVLALMGARTTDVRSDDEDEKENNEPHDVNGEKD
ncbi:longevity assurance proteins LAG1/LAC1 [Obba rivulosa]|uniref:Longevity assurance proteins LAG1/LAC1 n=1 Tax=Obba rivulosa TaxID=1052685 RepID=A0A8E2AMR3_9APHY|nr:longevity assurance proteins LAG1/LAC1 [Obba rivulosa]